MDTVSIVGIAPKLQFGVTLRPIVRYVDVEKSMIRTFVLRRHRDISGVSGTGTVAEGVVWTDGTVSLRWLGAMPTLEHLNNVDHLVAIHGHGGATEVRFDPTFQSLDWS